MWSWKSSQSDKERTMSQVPPEGGQPVPPGEHPQQYGPYGQAPPSSGQPPSGYPQYGGTPHGDPQYGGGQYGGPQYAGGQYAGPQYGGPQLGSQQYGQYGQYGAPTAAMAPPIAAQPGIIPLRPLTLGEIYDGAFRAVRTNPGVMFGLAAVIVGATLLLQTAMSFIILDQLETALLRDAATVDFTMLAGGALGIVLTALLTSLATLVYTGLAIVSVSESVLGNKVSLGELWRRAKGRVWRLVLLTIVESVGAFLAIAAIYAVMVLLFIAVFSTAALAESTAGIILGIILVPVFMLALGVLIAYIAVKLMLAPCVVMLEGTGVFAALARSWRLVKGHFWRLLGIMLLTMIIVMVVMSVVSMPVTMGFGIFMPDNLTVNLVVSSLASLISSLITIPLLAAVMALLYIDVRMRKEGLDIELAHAAAAGR